MRIRYMCKKSNPKRGEKIDDRVYYPKIVVRKDIGKRWYDENGILNINLIDFLLDKELI